MRVCAIHQPQYMPWLGYFDKIDSADVFVFLDATQFKKNEWQNRNRILAKTGPQWLTVPVKHRFGQQIRETSVDDNSNWRRKHLNTLKACYGRSRFFGQYADEIAELLRRDWSSLSELNVAFVKYLAQQLGITSEFVLASQLQVEGRSSELLGRICQAVHADVYLSGVGGRGYLDESVFDEVAVKTEYQSFQCVEYPQLLGGFEPALSALDILFNCGDKSLAVLRAGSP